MTRTVTLPGTDLTTSALGYGCAGLFAEPSSAQRRRLMESAHAAGIRHFDVAPMYGLGLGERELGRVTRGRRDEFVIATKFGIDATAVARSLARVQSPLRRLLRSYPALRRHAQTSAAGPASGPAGGFLYRATGFDSQAARASLERSLREIGTDYVDLFLLHDPQPDGVRSDDICAYLEEARGAGRIRTWGIAGEPTPSLAVARLLLPSVPVLQLREDILTRTPGNASGPFSAGRITFGVLGRSVRRIVTHVSANSKRRRQWQAAVGRDCADAEVVGALLLRQAARDNPDGVVLFTSLSGRHLRAAARVMADAPAKDCEGLDAFVGLVQAELRGASPPLGVRQ
jgi:D-threo-aldose 1-dehydrogenase